MRIDISVIINFYMFICIALLVYNIAYIFRGKVQNHTEQRAVDVWKRKIRAEYEQLENGQRLSKVHARALTRKLKDIDTLIDYHKAVSQLREELPQVQKYLDACFGPFQTLAMAYGKRPSMERAYYAHLMAEFHPNRDHSGHQLAAVLLEYLDDSTVYCRENVLQAIYATGHANAVIQALGMLNTKGWYHHSRLISDGLMQFPGDKTELAWRLWRQSKTWDESMQVAVVQFAANTSDAFSAEFLEALQNEKTPLETRFALVRYFQRHPYIPAHPVLMQILQQEGNKNGSPAIAAAQTLARYPGEQTHRVLMEALHSRNWYVRKNSAFSLVALGAAEEDLETLRQRGDRYAVQMLEYVLENKRIREAHAGRSEKVGV